MRRSLSLFGVLLSVVFALSCAGNTGPAAPDTAAQPGPAVSSQAGGQASQNPTWLWGFYDVWFDFESKSVEAVPNRTTQFSANVVKFLNGSPPGISFAFNGVTPGSGYVDVDLDVTITHPLDDAGFDGYDVRGIFIGNGSYLLDYGLWIADTYNGTDQVLMNADGYTRWFNPTEFPTPKIWGYIPGDFAPPGYTGTATVNPYKYFGDGLQAADDLWDYLTTGQPTTGYFLHGTSNTRNYQIRFPTPLPGIKYNYAVVANWSGTQPSAHPSHAPEAVSLDVVDNSTLWFDEGSSSAGGDLDLEISVFDWFSVLDGGVMEDYNIIIDSTVQFSPYTLNTSEMTPTASGNHWFTYHVVIPQDDLHMLDGNEMVLVVEYPNLDYKNPAGVMNAAWDEPVAAFFRYDLSISPTKPVSITVLTPNGGEQWPVGSDQDITWTSVNVTGNVFVEYSKDNFNSDVNTIALDESNDGIFKWSGIPCDMSNMVKVRVSSSDSPSVSDKSDGFFSIPHNGWAETWGNTGDDSATDIAADNTGSSYATGYIGTLMADDDCFLAKYDPCGNLEWTLTWGGDYSDEVYGAAVDIFGNVYVTGYFDDHADFDPGPGEDIRYSNGGYDIFLSKFDSAGNYQWALTWGGSNDDYGVSVTTDTQGAIIYLTGYFYNSVDFDPGPGEDTHVSEGGEDVYLCMFNSDGEYQGAATWGGTDYDEGLDIAVDSLGNVSVAGYFNDVVDFDPGPGTMFKISVGLSDCFVSLFDFSGNWQWAQTWGSVSSDSANAVGTDVIGDVYVVGQYQETIDFDPGPGTDNHTSGGGFDSFLNVFDPAGGWLWTKTWGGPDSNTSEGVVVAPTLEIYVSGAFRGTGDFDPGPGDYPMVSNGNADVFLVCFSSIGEIWWGRSWGDSSYNSGQSLAMDQSGNTFTVSDFSESMDFAPTDPLCGNSPDVHDTNGGFDVAVSKFLPSGCW
jgi:hypothetical protein